MTPDLLPAKLRELFTYNPSTGILVWKSPAKNKQWLIGRPAGNTDTNGRLRLEIDGQSYSVHRICFAIHYGRWPAEQLDHINRDKKDNRIENLREATNAENSRNRARSKPTKTGIKGVTFHKGRFIARIMKDGKAINLGSFDNAADAGAAYQSAATAIHEGFACPTN